MGCDGGSIVDRRELIVKLKDGKKKVDKHTYNILNWTTCRLSKDTLQKPIVACRLGFLYNKEQILKALLEKTIDKKLFGHVRGMKDLVEVKFTDNPAAKDNPNVPKFICPISQQEVTGQYRFYLNRNCGHVVSEKALKEIESDTCLVCGAPYSKQTDLTLLNPPKDELKELRRRLKHERKALKNELKNEKQKKKKKKNVVSGPQKAPAIPQSAENPIPIPKGATPEVWKSIFIDKSKEQKEDPNNFLRRPGMRSAAEI